MKSQLISYIAPAAPATRRPATGDEPFVRPEIGFTPKWYRQTLNIDFGERWHTDLEYRNCSVNMVSPDLYGQFLLPQDRRIADRFETFAIHNCSWSADPYLEHYASIPNLGYIDMGPQSDLARARDLMPLARRALMYTPMDLANRSELELRADFTHIAQDYGPCDIVMADVEAGTPDERVRFALDLCHELNG